MSAEQLVCELMNALMYSAITHHRQALDLPGSPHQGERFQECDAISCQLATQALESARRRLRELT